ncbi:MAG TPA: hypothetical protein VMS98_20015 [Thermoanaerobaculia bacterium]|nr:hypothetical protein [Thermoanaerobaculia bacterium]
MHAHRQAMRFTIEQRHLTDDDGKPVRDPNLVAYHAFDAESVDDVVRLFVKKEGAEVIGAILKFPGYQAVATVRSTSGVYTLQVSPSSGKLVGR